jgi:tetratricopeptide (TPR) repeat protein
VYSEYLVGVFKKESGKVLEAVDHLEHSWRMSGHDKEIGLRLADGYYMLKNFTRCEMVVDEILDETSTQFDALLLKGKLRYINHDASGAVTALEAIRSAHERSFEPERLLGNIYYELGEREKAAQAYQNCIDMDGSYPFIFLRYGRLLGEMDRVDEAESAYKRAMELDAGFSEPALALSDLYLESGRSSEAIALLEALVKRHRTNNEALINLLELYFATANYDDGIALLEDRRKQTPLSREGEVMRGRMYYEAQRFDEAFEVFDELFRREQNNAELARILGEIGLRRGERDVARGYFDRAIALEPDVYRNHLGLFFAASEEFSSSETIIELSREERLALLNTASELVPGIDFDGNYMVGIAYLSMDALDEAEIHLLRAREMKGQDRATLLNIANLHEKRNEYEKAIEPLQELYEQDPNDPTVCNFYGYVLGELNRDLDFASDLVKSALKQDPGNGYYLDSLGWIYYQQGEYAQAVIQLERANLAVPNDPTILEHLGDAFATLKRFSEARAAYERSNKLQDGDTDIHLKIESLADGP